MENQRHPSLQTACITRIPEYNCKQKHGDVNAMRYLWLQTRNGEQVPGYLKFRQFTVKIK
jgi:hypothetical protein